MASKTTVRNVNMYSIAINAIGGILTVVAALAAFIAVMLFIENINTSLNVVAGMFVVFGVAVFAGAIVIWKMARKALTMD